MAKRERPLEVIYSERSSVELKGIWRYNATHRSVREANNYEDFLVRGIEKLSYNYSSGKPVVDFPELRAKTLKKRSGGDGHIVIYEVDLAAGAVYILHLFHTKMDIEGRLHTERGA